MKCHATNRLDTQPKLTQTDGFIKASVAFNREAKIGNTIAHVSQNKREELVETSGMRKKEKKEEGELEEKMQQTTGEGGDRRKLRGEGEQDENREGMEKRKKEKRRDKNIEGSKEENRKRE